MPLRPNLIERFLIGRGEIPPVLLDVGLSAMQVWLMIGAMEIGLFEALEDGPLDVQTLADRTDASERGIRVVVQVLEPLGYLESDDGRYRLSDMARRSLPIGLLRDFAPFIKHQMTVYTDVERALREAPEDGIYGWEHVQSGEIGRSYQTFMRWLASLNVDEVVKKVDLPSSARRMLDVGGSHGLYTVAFCRKYPDLRGTVLDWPIGLEAARRTLDENPDVADRIDLVKCDFEREEVPDGYDFALLGNIVHGISPEGNSELFGKLARSTGRGGAVAILDQLAGVSGSKFARAVAGLIGFNLFLFSGGRSYPLDELRDWLAEAGFSELTHSSLRQPGFSLVVARKPG